MTFSTAANIAAIGRIGVVPSMLAAVVQLTGMRYAVIARVTTETWIACAVLDKMGFGLNVGGELDVASTLCSEVRDHGRPIVIEDASSDSCYADHPLRKKFGISSYIAVPIVRQNGEFFGTLCAIDTNPARLSGTGLVSTLELFAKLVSAELDSEERHEALMASREAFREKSERLQLALSANGMGTWEMDLVNDKRVWSGETLVMHGLDPTHIGSSHIALNDDIMHPDDRKRLAALHAELRAGRDRYEFDYRTKRNGKTRFLSARGTVLKREARGPTRIVGVVADITDRKIAEEETARMAAVVAASHDALFGVSLDGSIQTWNPGATKLFGYDAGEAIGRHIGTLAGPARQQEQSDFLTRLRAGETVGPVDTQRLRKDGTIVDVSMAIAPVKSRDGSVIAISAAAHDVGARKEWEARQKLMTRELVHRVKNSFAVLQAILHSTLKSTPDPVEFAEVFSGRLHSLAAAQDILTASDWKGAELGALARHELAFCAADEVKRLTISGPPVNLAAEYATPFGIVLHELATNAVKHGALSRPTGKIDLSWRVESTGGGGSRLFLTWRESGGPKVIAPERTGYGFTLIEKSLAGARVEQRFEPDGLVCMIELPFTPVEKIGRARRPLRKRT